MPNLGLEHAASVAVRCMNSGSFSRAVHDWCFVVFHGAEVRMAWCAQRTKPRGRIALSFSDVPVSLDIDAPEKHGFCLYKPALVCQ